MPNTSESQTPKPVITIPIVGTSTDTYRDELRTALLDVLKRVHEGGELELSADENYSQYLLLDLAKKL